jgi:hypothetical protein
MRTGQLWDVDTFLGMDFRKQLDLGRGAAAVHRQKQRDRLIDEYGYDFARTGRDAMVAFLALAERRLDAAVEAADVYLEHPVGMLNLLGLGTKAKAQLLMGAIDEAGETLDRADRLLAQTGRVTPFHDADRSTTRLLHTNSVLERALQTGDREGSRRLIRRGRYDARKALSTSARAARVRTETYRLVGTFEWLRGRERRGAAWWLKSIAEGERLGARPELARTHREVARRLAAAPGGVVDVAGGGSDVHLAAAKKLFRELELTAELAELEPIVGVMGRAG